MTKDEENKPTEMPAETVPPKTRKIVRRTASTREHPAFTAEAPAADGAPAAAPVGAEAVAKPVSDGSAPRERATYDARAPRTRPPEGRTPRSSGDYRPPPGRPMGARPIPGGPRAPAGDYQPPPGRPIGARPIPGGSRAPAGDFRAPAARPVGARPIPGGPRAPSHDVRPRWEPGGAGDDRETLRAPPRHGPAAAPAAAKPAAAPAKPAVAATKTAPPVKAKGGPAPLPLSVPLPRAGGKGPQGKPALTAKEVLSLKAKAASGGKAKPAAASKPEAASSAAFDAELVRIGAEGAVEAVRTAGDAGVALVDAWLAASNAAAVAVVAEAEGLSGLVRKAARRAVGVLRARGVTITEAARVVRIDDRAEVSIEATLLPPDGSGTFALTLSSKDASGRHHVAEVIVREPAGVVQAGSGWLSGTQLKEARARALESLGLAPVAVPVDWARHRIAAARKLNATSGQILPLGLDRCDELVTPTTEAAPPHPIADLEGTVTPETAAAAIAASTALHAEPEFRTWMPERSALDELIRNVGERARTEAEDDDKDKVTALIREEIENATDRTFTPELRATLANRMRDGAISVRARKGDRAASDVLAVANAVRDAGLITAPPRDIPFLIAFFQKALGVLAQRSGAQVNVPGVARAGQ